MSNDIPGDDSIMPSSPLKAPPLVLDSARAKGLAPAYILRRQQHYEQQEQRRQIHAKRAADSRANAAAMSASWTIGAALIAPSYRVHFPPISTLCYT